MIYLVLVAIGFLVLMIPRIDRSERVDFLNKGSKTVFVSDLNSTDAVNLANLTNSSRSQKIRIAVSNLYKQIGNLAALKVTIFYTVVTFLSIYLNSLFLKVSPTIAVSTGIVLSTFIVISWLRKRQQKDFENSFPDALNIMLGAITSGESLMHSIIFVGSSLDTVVGKEFKRMGERLQIGEPPDEVFRKASERFPYSPFFFFVITLRANMSRGGQLKDVMRRLNRLMFDGRAVDKKKYAMTAEARMSAKVVGSIPFIFLIVLSYLNPENFDFVMNEPDGRPILYYLLISESIGMLIIWLLMKGVR